MKVGFLSPIFMQASVASMGRSVVIVMNNEKNLASGNADIFLTS